MSTENAISIVITEEDNVTADGGVKTLEQVLPKYLIALTPAQRKALPKMSDKTAPFVEKVLEYTTTAPEFIPSFMNVPEMKKDLDAYSVLNTLFRRISNLTSGLDDTVLLAGSEAYKMALAYYNAVKQAAKMNVLSAKPIYEELRKRFDKVTKEAKTETTENA